jgi:hypothetical protein
LAIALVLSLGATAVMAVAWSRDREANRVALANNAAKIHMLEKGISSQPAQPTAPSASEAPTASSTPVASAPAASGTPPFVWPYAQLTHMTDSLGNDWIYPSMGAQPLTVNDGTVITFTAFAKEGANRPLEFVFWQGVSPTQKTICAWGSSRCTWTAKQASCYTPCPPIQVYVAVRGVNATSYAWNGPCYKTEPCDTFFDVRYNVIPPH